MSLLITIILFLIFVFRRTLFERFVGNIGILIGDSVLLVVIAAYWFANNSWPLFGPIMGTFSLLIAFLSSLEAKHLIEQKKNEKNDTNG